MISNKTGKAFDYKQVKIRFDSLTNQDVFVYDKS